MEKAEEVEEEVLDSCSDEVARCHGVLGCKTQSYDFREDFFCWRSSLARSSSPITLCLLLRAGCYTAVVRTHLKKPQELPRESPVDVQGLERNLKTAFTSPIYTYIPNRRDKCLQEISLAGYASLSRGVCM